MTMWERAQDQDSDPNHEDKMPLRGVSTFEHYEQESYESIRRRGRMRYKCLRITLIILIVLTILIGLAFMTMGIVPLVMFHTKYTQISFMFNFIYVLICANGFLVIGVLFTIMCIVGIIAVVRLGRCLLNAFALGLAIACVITIIGGVLFVVFKNDVMPISFRTDEYKDAILQRYGVDTEKNETNKLVTDVVDFIQVTFECCGSSGNVSADNSWGLFKNSEWYYVEIKDKYPKVPKSCCVKNGDLQLCQGKDRVRGPPNDGPGIQRDKTLYENENLHRIGCFDMISKNSGKYIFIFGITLVSVMALPIAAMGLAFCLGCFVDRDRY